MQKDDLVFFYFEVSRNRSIQSVPGSILIFAADLKVRYNKKSLSVITTK
jgi:hypothetical protein